MLVVGAGRLLVLGFEIGQQGKLGQKIFDSRKLLGEDGKLFELLVSGVERELIEQVMQLCDNVQVKAAARLGINRNTLHKKLGEFELEKE